MAGVHWLLCEGACNPTFESYAEVRALFLPAYPGLQEHRLVVDEIAREVRRLRHTRHVCVGRRAVSPASGDTELVFRCLTCGTDRRFGLEAPKTYVSD